MLGYKIPNNKKSSIKSKIEIYNKPKVVYIPLVNGNDTDVTLLVKKDDDVKLGKMIAKTKGDMRIPILSSVSGRVVDITEKEYLNGKKVKCVVIENDFDDELNKEKVNKKYNKQEFIELLQEKGIVGMSGTSFPTYVKYDSTKKIKTLIVNATSCDPYVASDFVLIKEHPEEILEAIDMIMEINDIKECFIAIKKDNKELKDLFDSYSGTYPSIKISLLPSFYPIGYERLLVKYIKKETYKNVPLEKGIVVNNISTIYAIYQALMFDNPLVERVITINGLTDNKLNVLVKIGTSVKEIIENYGKINNDLVYITNGVMMGNRVDVNELVVSSNLNSIIALKEIKECEVDCINCGKCVDVCPERLCPILIKDNINDLKNLKNLKPYRCMECGLCSYICPSRIDLRKSVVEAKDKVKGGK